MLLNSMVAGAVAAAYIFILFLQLNPSVPRSPWAVAPLAASILHSFGVHFSAVF
jgi:hypothetical protein